ncbi:NAD(P)-dependent oxidoreductase [Pendulispora brunnea]|uniref:NAD(P)-dependent oxidoreductase n=1 Tax=Pendulispora brunnea TaxID=2905690 RepID=A0ABZ2K1S6_9BACT
MAFLGLGAMGAPMAANVARKGFALQVWNRHHERAQSLTALGAKVKSSPAECARGARVIVTMVRDESVLLQLLSRPDGILAGMDKDAVIVDMSTIGRAGALKAAAIIKEAGGRFVDSPVGGTVGPAERGELVAFAGGRLNDVSRAQPVLLAMCKRIIHAGDVGQGQALKVLVNGLGVHHLIAYTSMLALGERAGLTRRTIVEAFSIGAFASPQYVGKKEKMLAKDYSPEFSLDLMLKDALLNVDLQQEAGLPLPVLREALRAIENAIEEGLGEEDLFALEKYYRNL